MTLPDSVAAYLLQRTLGERPVAWILVDGEGEVREAGGATDAFGLADLAAGERLTERLIALQGALPGSADESLVLPQLELVPGRSADVHVGALPDGAFVLLIDTTAEAEREHRLQQRGNELGLLLRRLGVVVFEVDDEHRLTRRSPVPSWLRAVRGSDEDDTDLAARVPFLEGFLETTGAAAWAGNGPRVSWSGMWVEEDEVGRDWQLEAAAVRLEDGRRLLVLTTAERHYREHGRILQRARAQSLDVDRMRRESDKKEVLLHCIVHDLRGPLASMVGTMSLIRSCELDAERKHELLELGLEQARLQEAMIRGVLDAFSLEIEALEHFESEVGRAPDVLAVLRHVHASYTSAFDQNGVALELELDPELDPVCPVVGDERRLERVFSNLLENALRHSREKGSVRLALAGLSDGYRVTIEDEGPGVPVEEQPALFDKLTQGSASRGTTGLGLYFCRSTVEMWGGRIGYAEAEPRGACFWVELASALPAGAAGDDAS